MARSSQIETGVCCHAGTYNTHGSQKRMFENGPVSIIVGPVFLTSCEVKLNLNATVVADAEVYIFDTNLPAASITSVMAVIRAGGKAICISDGKAAGSIFSWDPSVEEMISKLVTLGVREREVFEMLGRPMNYGLAVAVVNPVTGNVVVGSGTNTETGIDQLMFVDTRFMIGGMVLV